MVSVVLLKRRRMEFNYRGDLNTKLVQFSYGKSVTYIDGSHSGGLINSSLVVPQKIGKCTVAVYFVPLKEDWRICIINL